jgi:Domain of unknown function (DUF4032)/Lipopolysaccharide kinase (Kdo/WaaP) family
MGDYTLTTVGVATELIDLPYGRPLAEWDDSRIVQVPRGISRHVVRFIRAHGQIFAIKEATDRYVLREHQLLRALALRHVPAVETFGTVTDREDNEGEELGGLLITRHLAFSLPYRSLFTGRTLPDLRARLLDALAQLFVRLHLAGFYWGDCSLSNTLFRRDAGELSAYLVDAETGELHPQLTPGQRRYDVQIATENIAGELFDLESAGWLSPDIDPIETAQELTSRYEGLWAELHTDAVVPANESYLIDQRIRRLNALGFDVSEVEIHTEERGRNLRLTTQVVEPGHHQRRFFALTGLHVQENQARRLLADLARFRAKLIEGIGEEVPEDLSARRWLDEKFYGVISQVPPELRSKMPDAELYHEINEHRWFLSEARGQDVGRAEAVRSYVENVLRFLPDAKVQVLTEPTTEELPVVQA